MAALFVLVVSLLLLRAVGLLGVKRLSSWREAGVVAVAIMFLFTGATHFTVMKHDTYGPLDHLPDRSTRDRGRGRSAHPSNSETCGHLSGTLPGRGIPR
jgi:hypothetical protein